MFNFDKPFQNTNLLYQNFYRFKIFILPYMYSVWNTSIYSNVSIYNNTILESSFKINTYPFNILIPNKGYIYTFSAYPKYSYILHTLLPKIIEIQPFKLTRINEYVLVLVNKQLSIFILVFVSMLNKYILFIFCLYGNGCMFDENIHTYAFLSPLCYKENILHIIIYPFLYDIYNLVN